MSRVPTNPPQGSGSSGSGGDMTTDGAWVAAGDLIVGTGENTASILTKGTEGQILKVGSTTLEWGAVSGTGDVVGPSSSVTNNLASYDGITGKLIKDSGLSGSDFCLTNDSRLTDARTPTTHATAHVTGGSDIIADAIASGNSGLLSGSDKAKLDGIASGAEVNVQSDWNATEGDALILNKPSIPSEYTLPTATDAILGGVKVGDRLNISDGVLSADVQGSGAHATSHVTGGDDVIADVVAAGNSGLMSGTDKTKLDGIAESANAYTLPTATDAILGGVKVGDRLNISDGVLSADVQGSGGAYAIVSQSSATYNATQTSGNIIILCDCTSNAITVNLPTAVGNTTTFTIKKTSGNYDITIDGNSTETIDSYLTYPITTLNQSVTIVSNDTNWAIT